MTEPAFIQDVAEDDTVIIVACNDKRVIGKNGQIPWHYSDDLAQFKAHTTQNAVIMGRKTFEGIENQLGEPLPNRRNIVLSRTRETYPDDVIHAEGFQSALAAVPDEERTYIAGGAAVYEQALPVTDAIIRTNIPDEVDGDTYFPSLSDEWDVVETTQLNNQLTVSLLR